MNLADVHTPEADASDDGGAALPAHDPLGKIEDMTGNYRDKPSLGLAYVGVHYSRKNKVLTDRGDTTFSMDTQSYIDVLEAHGYVLLSSDTVSVQQYDDPPRDESWYILAHPDGLVLYFDTHHGQRNSAKVCYVWRPVKDLENRWQCTSSGHMEGSLWIGDHDAREAGIFNMERLRQNGKLLKSCLNNVSRGSFPIGRHRRITTCRLIIMRSVRPRSTHFHVSIRNGWDINMAMPPEFKYQCAALAENQSSEIATAIHRALEADDHDALDDALQLAVDASDRRLDSLRQARLLQNKLMGRV